MKAATGSFGIVFPAGGTLDGGVSKRLSEAFAQGQVPWGLYSGSFPFTAATIDGTIKPGTVALMLDGEAVGSRIGGSLHIAVPSGQVSGTLVMRPDEGTGEMPPAFRCLAEFRQYRAFRHGGGLEFFRAWQSQPIELNKSPFKALSSKAR